MNHNLPITLLSWGLAVLPLLVLVILLIGLNWSIVKSGLVTLVTAIATSFFIFQTPLQGILVALGRGMWNSIEIILVISSALLFYYVCLHAGAFEAIQKGMKKISSNKLFLTLLIGWVFTSFLQGVTGFGTPVAIVAPILISIGLKPAYAVVIPLISQGWSNIFGALGVAWTVTSDLVQLDSEPLTIFLITILLAIGAFTNGLFIAWLYAGWRGIKEAFLLIIFIASLMGIGQIIVAQFIPLLAVIIPAFIALILMFLLAKLNRFKEPSQNETHSPILQGQETQLNSNFKNVGNLSLNQALLPFYLLTGLTVLVVGIPSLFEALSLIQIPGFDFSGVVTGFDYATQPVDNFQPIAIFTTPTVYLLVSSGFAYLYFRSKNAYQNTNALGRKLVRETTSSAWSPALAILIFLVMSQLLLVSGQNAVLALGISRVTPPILYAALSPWIGVASVFMTSSTVAGNTLFVPLQEQVVQTMPSLSINQIIAYQSSGSSIANVIGPSNIVLGISTVEAQGQKQKIYRLGLLYTALTVIIYSLLAIGLHLIFS